MKQQSLYIFCFGLLILLISCKKENQSAYHDAEVYYLREDIKPFMFKTGTYWIFENDSSYELDSILVTNTTQDIFLQILPRDDSYYQEYYQYNWHDFLKSEDHFDYLSDVIIRRDVGGPNYNGPKIFCTALKVGEGFENIKLIDSIPKLYIHNKLFCNVALIKISNQMWPNIFPNDTYYWWQSYMGVIRKTVDYGNGNIESWSLKRWKIIL